MWISTFVFCGFVLCATADWTTKIYDVIVVGAGPAGIIGICFAIFLSSNSTASLLSLTKTRRVLHDYFTGSLSWIYQSIWHPLDASVSINMSLYVIPRLCPSFR
jgi:hypothetical protein